MKKSEAIKIIADWMSGERHGTGITTKYTLQSAQELLDILVNELGMNPPECQIVHKDANWGPTLREWEPEDETQ